MRFLFRRDTSPKFGDVWLLEGYGSDSHAITWCEGRRILIHRGNAPSGSADCWLIGKKTANFADQSDNASTVRVCKSVDTLNEALRILPHRMEWRLVYGTSPQN